MTPTALATFRSILPGCTLAVWGDIEARTVLAADGDLLYPQEYLDTLNICAAQLLSTPVPKDCTALDSAVFSGPTGSRLFVRSPDQPTIALSCLCSPDIDFEHVLQAMADLIPGADAQDEVQ